MDADAKRTLIAKIEELSSEEQKRVEGYVDALREETSLKNESGAIARDDANAGAESGEGTLLATDDAGKQQLSLSLRGALSHLKGEYTAEELQEKAKEWRIRKALDY